MDVRILGGKLEGRAILGEAFRDAALLDQGFTEASARESVLNRDWESIYKELIDHYRAAIRAKQLSLSTQGVA